MTKKATERWKSIRIGKTVVKEERIQKNKELEWNQQKDIGDNRRMNDGKFKMGRVVPVNRYAENKGNK